MKRYQLMMNLWDSYNGITDSKEFDGCDEITKTIIASELSTILNIVRVWTQQCEEELCPNNPCDAKNDIDEALYFFAVVVIAIENTNYAAHCMSKLTIIAQMLDKPFFLLGLQAAFEGTPPHKERMKQFAKELQPKITKKLTTMAERTSE